MENLPQHPELAAEQEYFDAAADHRERRRAKALNPDAGLAGINPAAAKALRAANKGRAAAMGGPDTPVAFGRLAYESGDTFYVGYFPILDDRYNPLVIGWQAPQAAPFRQATREDRMGAEFRRHFTTEANTILAIADERLVGEPDLDAHTYSRDAILRALAQHRDGRLTDIVKTIERAQDEAMRAPSDGVLVVQGGPGTGKTVIGLQRISVIAYREELEPQDLLFVGPNSGFLQYVGQVLPSLGDDGLSQLAITNLAPIRPRTVHPEPADVARVKGDPRMVELLSRALRDRRSSPDTDTHLEVEGRSINLTPSDIWEEMKGIEEAGRPHNIARVGLRDRLIRLVVDRANDDAISRGRLPIGATEVRGNNDFNNLLDRIWPTFSPQEFLRDLLASERRLKEHRWGLFEEDEILRIARPPMARISDEPWSAADLALLDEIEVLLNGLTDIRRYQHVVVDEAQDFSPLQLRAIQRRRAKGITILGDLAQATGAWAHQSWDEVTRELGSPEDASVVELTVGYRVPSEVMAIANRIGESLRLPVRLPEPVRQVGELPRFIVSQDEPVVRTVVGAVREYLSNGWSVGLIVPEASVIEVAAALRYEGLQYGDGRETTTKPITLVTPTSSKGLEFDAVVMLEPADITGSGDGGLNELFVALTRTTRALSIVYAKPLPRELETFGPLGGHEVHPDTTGSDEGELDSAQTPLTEPDGPQVILADDVIRGLVESVATAVEAVLQPAAIDSFLAQLSNRLGRSRSDDEHGDGAE